MSADLPRAPEKYDPQVMQTLINHIAELERRLLRKDQHAELWVGAKWVLSSPDGTRFAIVVDNGGTLDTETM